MPTVTKFPSTNQSAGAPFNGAWTNPNSAHTDNSTSATSVSATEVASAAPGKNQEYATVWSVPFSTSDIPDGATINSVTVGVEWRVSTTASVATLQSTAFADSGQSTAVSASPGLSNAAEPTNLTAQTYTATPTLAQLRDLWVRVQALRGNTNTAVTAYLDYVKVTVDYTAPPTPVTGTGGVSFRASTAGTGTVVAPPAAITGTGGVAFGLATAGSGSYTVTPITGSGSVAFSPATSGTGTVELPAVSGLGGVSFGFSLAGTGSQTASVHGSGGVSFGLASGGSGAVLPPGIVGTGGVSFGITTTGEGAYSVTPIDGTGAVSVGIATAGSGTVSPPPNTGSGGVSFGFSTSGASRTAGEPPWVREGVTHLGHKPNH